MKNGVMVCKLRLMCEGWGMNGAGTPIFEGGRELLCNLPSC